LLAEVAKLMPAESRNTPVEGPKRDVLAWSIASSPGRSRRGLAPRCRNGWSAAEGVARLPLGFGDGRIGRTESSGPDPGRWWCPLRSSARSTTVLGISRLGTADNTRGGGRTQDFGSASAGAEDGPSRGRGEARRLDRSDGTGEAGGLVVVSAGGGSGPSAVAVCAML